DVISITDALEGPCRRWCLCGRQDALNRRIERFGSFSGFGLSRRCPGLKPTTERNLSHRRALRTVELRFKRLAGKNRRRKVGANGLTDNGGKSICSGVDALDRR